MEPDRITITPRTLIGKEGDTAEGEGFIERLWAEANSRFGEIAPMVRMTEEGMPVAIWGAMTDRGRRFLPWEKDFTDGLYLAGTELSPGEVAVPVGWTTWDLPGFVCLRFAVVPGEDTFSRGLAWLIERDIPLVGAVQEWTIPAEGKCALLFPIERI